MSQKHRQDQILKILEDHKFVTVKFLVETLHYSSATINRDLNEMQNLNLVKRSYGGVEASQYASKPFLPVLPMREFYHKSEKRKLAKKACTLIENGDSIFLSGTTTVQHMIPFLAEKKNLTVVTNGLRIAMELAALDFNVICLGGEIFERPHTLCSDLTIENAMKFHLDKMFFSHAAITEDGNFSGFLLYKIIIQNSKKSYLLMDKTKLTDTILYSPFNFSDISGIISDFDFPEKTKEAFPNTDFIVAKD